MTGEMQGNYSRSQLFLICFGATILTVTFKGTTCHSVASESPICIPKEAIERDVYLALRWETLVLLLNIPRGMRGDIEMDCHRNNACKYLRTIEAWYIQL